MGKRFASAIRHGLAIEETSNDDMLFIEKITAKAKAHHMTFPLAILLEGLRPLSGMISSLLIGLEPFAELFFQKNSYQKLISFIGNRENLNKLISFLEGTGIT